MHSHSRATPRRRHPSHPSSVCCLWLYESALAVLVAFSVAAARPPLPPPPPPPCTRLPGWIMALVVPGVACRLLDSTLFFSGPVSFPSCPSAVLWKQQKSTSWSTGMATHVTFPCLPTRVLHSMYYVGTPTVDSTVPKRTTSPSPLRTILPCMYILCSMYNDYIL